MSYLLESKPTGEFVLIVSTMSEHKVLGVFNSEAEAQAAAVADKASKKTSLKELDV